MTVYQQDSKINRLEIAKERVIIGILILIVAYFIAPFRNFGEHIDLYVFIPLSFFLIIAWIINAFNETIILRIEISELSGNLLIMTKSHFKEEQSLEFDVNTLALTTKTYPTRLRPSDKRIILSDKDNLLKISLRGYGIGQDNFENIVNELKKNYPQ